MLFFHETGILIRNGTISCLCAKLVLVSFFSTFLAYNCYLLFIAFVLINCALIFCFLLYRIIYPPVPIGSGNDLVPGPPAGVFPSRYSYLHNFFILLT